MSDQVQQSISGENKETRDGEGAAIGPPAAGERTLNGVLAVYQDDQLDGCVRSALKRKSRVKYRCMDSFANFLAFGTTAGAIYLFKLKSITHSSCALISMIPCNQGSIEVIRFLPTSNASNPLIAIGTSQGSLVIFRLIQLPDEQAPVCNEIYRAEYFTNNCRIKLLEYDQDCGAQEPSLSTLSFAKIYICDAANRLYSLDRDSIYSHQQTLRLFRSDRPALIFSVEGSNINQISVHRSQLLISTDETTRYLNETTNRTQTIGRKKRREGFFGACFFNPNYYKQLQQHQPLQPAGSSHTVYSSTNSVNELENVLIFVARPNFRLWQVSNKLEVMFTHQFEPLIKAAPASKVIELRNEFENKKLEDAAGQEEPASRAPEESVSDAVSVIADAFASGATAAQENGASGGDYSTMTRSAEANGATACGSNFEKIIPIHSSTLGSLLLSYTRRELYIVDPVGARLIVWHQQHGPAEIIQVCCNENEIFIWSSATGGSAQQQQQQQQFQVRRLVLLAPTQLVLELHRTQRHLSLVLFVQMFCEQFKRIMALPLSGLGIVTTEGGLLRNVLLNAWSCLEAREKESAELASFMGERCATFKEIIDQIVDESRQLRQSLENLTDSRFFMTMTAENIERLCCEPYTSLVSLDISIANLHTNHVIHFSKDALNRHKSLINLSQSLKNLSRSARQTAQSTLDVSRGGREHFAANGVHPDQVNAEAPPGCQSTLPNDANVIVERHYYPSSRPARQPNHDPEPARNQVQTRTIVKSANGSFFSQIETIDTLDLKKNNSCPIEEANEGEAEDEAGEENGSLSDASERRKDSLPSTDNLAPFLDANGRLDLSECINNRDWIKPRAHLSPMYSSQQIQFKWIQENLVPEFERNVDEIERQALKHCLWHLLLKCLAFKNRLDEFIDCCIMLDDIRLFSVKQFADKNNLTEEEIVDRLFEHLEHKLEYVNYDDEISFNLVNLFEQFLMRRDIKRYIQHLLKYPKLVNESKIPASFYLKAVASSALSFSSGGYNFGN